MGRIRYWPSRVLISGEDLQEHIEAHNLPKDNLPLPLYDRAVLMDNEILSIAKALLLQTHQDKEVAARLHKLIPENFTESNHKLELRSFG